jgi:hypothetical protein
MPVALFFSIVLFLVVFGAAKKEGGVVLGLIVGGIFFIGSFLFLFYQAEGRLPFTSTADKIQVTINNPEQDRKDIIEKQFSSWDGSHRKLETIIKASMNDPANYQHVKTVYWDKKDYIMVKTTFRGKNAFNATVTNTITAKVGIDGEIIELIENE